MQIKMFWPVYLQSTNFCLAGIFQGKRDHDYIHPSYAARIKPVHKIYGRAH